MESHAEFLRQCSQLAPRVDTAANPRSESTTSDDDLVAALRNDYRQAKVSAQDLAMLDYVAHVARDATRIKSEDLDQLRHVGFDDRAILQITLIAAWFSYINRVADALGVGRD